jgi:hypothetical protein
MDRQEAKDARGSEERGLEEPASDVDAVASSILLRGVRRVVLSAPQSL